MTSLADWLRARDITDADFAKRIDVARGTVGRYCRGERFPDPPTLLRIRSETRGAVTSDDMLATWSAANAGRAPAFEDYEPPVTSQTAGEAA